MPFPQHYSANDLSKCVGTKDLFIFPLLRDEFPLQYVKGHTDRCPTAAAEGYNLLPSLAQRCNKQHKSTSSVQDHIYLVALLRIYRWVNDENAL